jgi:broad specificity phosphatase PhoE
MEITLIRHDLSQQNTGELSSVDVGDCNIPLSSRAHKAHNIGRLLGAKYIREALLYRSPYLRTRQTMDRIIEGAGLNVADLRIFEDPRLREVEHGYIGIDGQENMRKVHGWFLYRYNGGESPADCFDRTCTFFDSMHRQAHRMKQRAKNGKRPNIIIVSHGLTIRCMVMRYLHLTIEQFESIHNPDNCDVITIAKRKHLKEEPVFTCGKWGVTGLRLRNK